MTADLLPDFGEYCQVRRLGEGDFGAVHRAVDTTLNRLVGLKVPHGPLALAPIHVRVPQRKMPNKP
jgi:hypothetical protein